MKTCFALRVKAGHPRSPAPRLDPGLDSERHLISFAVGGDGEGFVGVFYDAIAAVGGERELFFEGLDCIIFEVLGELFLGAVEADLYIALGDIEALGGFFGA